MSCRVTPVGVPEGRIVAVRRGVSPFANVSAQPEDQPT